MSTSPRDVALRYVEGHNVATLATTGPEGPWAAAVFYASTGFTLYFLSSPTSRHGRNIGRNAEVAATIQEDYSDWREIKGIQLEGRANRLAGPRTLGVERLAEAGGDGHNLDPVAKRFVDNQADKDVGQK